MLVFGMGLFTLGADIAMMPMGEKIGAQITKSRKISFLVIIALLLGIMITIAEPDLKILANQVPSVPNSIIIGSVALGVGLFLVLALLRFVLKWSLSYLLMVLYLVVFVLAFFAPADFVAVAFDSGGVTTGPITVPFILALGIGVVSVRGGKSSNDDSFGLVALCSLGPILSVLVMGMIFRPSGSQSEVAIAEVGNFKELIIAFVEAFPEYLTEVALAILPIVGFFMLFQLFKFKLPKSQIIKMGVGIIYTYLGLVIFLIAVNIGFMPAGNYLGARIVGLDYGWIIIPIGMVLGFVVVMAEPAVHVLNKQVEEITGGAISRRAMLWGFCVGVAIALGFAMIRVITGMNIFYFLIPCYTLALLLTFFVPKIFTAIAFDSGGVASGPMTATFILPFTIGACEAAGGNVLTDAFGVIAMVTMMPLITIQLMGFIYNIKLKRTELDMLQAVPADGADEEIIDF